LCYFPFLFFSDVCLLLGHINFAGERLNKHKCEPEQKQKPGRGKALLQPSEKVHWHIKRLSAGHKLQLKHKQKTENSKTKN